MQRGHQRRRLVVDDLHVLDLRCCAVDELAARDRGVVRAALTRLGVAPVDHLVLLIGRIQCDVEQSALATRVDHWQSFDGFRHRLAVCADDAQSSRPLGHEHASIGQPRHPPGVHESFSHRDDVERDVEFLLGHAMLPGEGRLLIRRVRWALVQSIFGTASGRSEASAAAAATWCGRRCAWCRRCGLLRREVKSGTKQECNSC